MNEIGHLLARLPIRHREALQWFIDRAGQDHSWPEHIEIAGEKTLLATKAKGIYKPRWSDYALSIRQTLGGPYPDRDPILRPDGTWLYAYFQENDDPAARDLEFTNLGLMACWRDRVPVGVMRQIKRRPNVQYQILGTALVAGWEDGYFYFEGFSPNRFSRGPGPAAQTDLILSDQENGDGTTFDLQSVKDARERAMASIVRRRGQPAFRRTLLDIYNGQCAFTGCDVLEALEAAHITPYRGAETNHVGNGLLLRADIHTLFDLGLLAVDPETRQVVVAHQLKGSAYDGLEGKAIAEPDDPELRPSAEALTQQFNWAQIRLPVT